MLSKIKNKLYQKKTPPQDQFLHETQIYNPKSPLDDSSISKPITEQDKWENAETPDWASLPPLKKKILKRGLWALGIILGIIILIIAGFEIRRFVFTSDEVAVSILGPNQTKSGQLLTYEIDFQNGNWLNINNAVLTLNYPENFQPENNPNFFSDSPLSGHFNLGTVKRGNSGKIIFNGKAYSPQGALIYLRAGLVYSAGSFSARYESKNQLGINIISAPLTLEVQAPQNITSGDKADYLITYRNDGAEALDSLKLKMDYPDGFSFSKGDPQPSEAKNIWYLGSLAPGESGKVVVSGTLSGERDQIKTIKAMIGTDQGGQFMSMSEESADTKISASPLSITQSVNNLSNLDLKAGDFLKFKLNYKNDGNIDLGNVIIKDVLDSPVLDYTSLNIPSGSFDIDKKTITWKASDIPALMHLAAGTGGSINFSINVKNVLPIGSENDKNFFVHSVASIDSPDVPTPISLNKIISSNVMDMKVSSKLTLAVKAFYSDEHITNSGPLPPKVGEETTYTLHWLLANAGNDIIGAQVSAYLPTGATMTGKVYPEDARINYDERSNLIIWDIGNVAANTGILNAPLEVSFQVKIKPSPDQEGEEVPLINDSTLSAHDEWTGVDLTAKASARTTNLLEDPTAAGKNRVAN